MKKPTSLVFMSVLVPSVCFGGGDQAASSCSARMDSTLSRPLTEVTELKPVVTVEDCFLYGPEVMRNSKASKPYCVYLEGFLMFKKLFARNQALHERNLSHRPESSVRMGAFPRPLNEVAQLKPITTEIECSICLEKKIKDYGEVQTLPCLHSICKTCYTKMRIKHLDTCPFCRTSFLARQQQIEYPLSQDRATADSDGYCIKTEVGLYIIAVGGAAGCCSLGCVLGEPTLMGLGLTTTGGISGCLLNKSQKCCYRQKFSVR